MVLTATNATTSASMTDNCAGQATAQPLAGRWLKRSISPRNAAPAPWPPGPARN